MVAQQLKLKQALISVSDKKDLVEFARQLNGLGVKIISTGGTAQKLREGSIPTEDVSGITGFPEILDGRVKTLHPKIFGGILARRDHPRHSQELEKHQIQPIDLVVVNLYPFKESPSIENIDIGGVTLLRAAAKNYRDVLVVCDPADYPMIIKQLQEKGDLAEEERRKLAQKAFAHTADYDTAIARFFLSPEDLFPISIQLSLQKIQDLRYGENPHQKAALYRSQLGDKGIVDANQLQGKELSFNNYLDLEAADSLVEEFSQPACVIVKHNNPCGVAEDKTLSAAYLNALACDPVSAFGGVIGFNRPVDKDTANELVKLFVECIIAPGYSSEAKDIFQTKKNLRLLEKPLNPPFEKGGQGGFSQLDYRCISGGFLVQEKDRILSQGEAKVVTNTQSSPEALRGLEFAWKVCKYVKSNAIILARGSQTVGIGAGQMSRIDALRIAKFKMDEIEKDILPKLGGKPLVLASDAFFPFPDVVEAAAKIGVKAIIQPGGSIKDNDSIEACNRNGITMLFTGTRHFRH